MRWFKIFLFGDIAKPTELPWWELSSSIHEISSPRISHTAAKLQQRILQYETAIKPISWLNVNETQEI